MKIIAKDNFDRDNVPDELVAENINKFMGSRVVHLLNESTRPDSPYYYFLVEDDYKLLTIDDIY